MTEKKEQTKFLSLAFSIAHTGVHGLSKEYVEIPSEMIIEQKETIDESHDALTTRNEECMAINNRIVQSLDVEQQFFL